MAENTSVWLPLWVKVQGYKCLVVGGGQVALRKIRMLLEAGAMVEVVTKRACQEVQNMAQAGLIGLKIKEVENKDLSGARVVVVATDSGQVNRRVSSWADEKGVLCNVVDRPELCTAVFPAILKRGRLEVAVSTGGASPAVAAKIRDHIAQSLQPGYELLLELLSEIRGRVKKMQLADEKRLGVLRSLVDEQVMKACSTSTERELKAMLEMRLERALSGDGDSGQNPVAGSLGCGSNTGEGKS